MAGGMAGQETATPRELYDTLFTLVQAGGYSLPNQTYYYDCGLGDRVVLPLFPSDLDRTAIQIQRMHSLNAKGKKVVFCIEMMGFGEDLFVTDMDSIVKGLKEKFWADLGGRQLLFTTPAGALEKIGDALGMKYDTKAEAQYLDLLDLLA